MRLNLKVLPVGMRTQEDNCRPGPLYMPALNTGAVNGTRTTVESAWTSTRAALDLHLPG